MSKTVTESIWDNGQHVIPMAEVSHIERDMRTDYDQAGGFVIFKHSVWNNEIKEHNPTVYLLKEDMKKFIRDWCVYRHELEIETLVDF